MYTSIYILDLFLEYLTSVKTSVLNKTKRQLEKVSWNNLFKPTSVFVFCANNSVSFNYQKTCPLTDMHIFCHKVSKYIKKETKFFTW